MSNPIQVQKQGKKPVPKQGAGNNAGGHQIFQEVIVEDEDENFNEHMNLNSSGLGNQFNLQN